MSGSAGSVVWHKVSHLGKGTLQRGWRKHNQNRVQSALKLYISFISFIISKCDTSHRVNDFISAAISLDLRYVLKMLLFLLPTIFGSLAFKRSRHICVRLCLPFSAFFSAKISRATGIEYKMLMTPWRVLVGLWYICVEVNSQMHACMRTHIVLSEACSTIALYLSSIIYINASFCNIYSTVGWSIADISDPR